MGDVGDEFRSDFERKYVSEGEILGEGMSGLVRVFRNVETGEQVAVKTLNLENISSSRRSMLLSEVDIYRRLSHPNIVNLIEIFQEQNSKIHLVMEICRGGELYERLAERSFYDERTAALLTRQMLSAVAYLHSLRVVHRDLKLEHWLFKAPSPSPSAPAPADAAGLRMDELKLCDFGFGSLVHAGVQLTATLGSVHYVAPEVLGGRYGLECDEWSLGVIVYMLLSGSPPFEGGTDEEIMSKISGGRYTMSGAKWERISEEGKDFVSRLLQVDPSQRMTAEEGLNHVWVSEDFFADSERFRGSGRREISRSVVDLIQSHGSQVCVLRAAVGLLQDISSVERAVLYRTLEQKQKIPCEYLDVHEFADLLRTVRHTHEDVLTKFTSIASLPAKIPLKDLLLFLQANTASATQTTTSGTGSSSSTRVRGIARVHSAPSKATEIFLPPGWYTRVLRPYYGRQPVSNLVMGLVHGWSGFARQARALRLSKVSRLSGADCGALFLLPNPKFHADLSALQRQLLAGQTGGGGGGGGGSRFVVWWIAREFVEDLERWHEEGGDSPKLQSCAPLGDPGDFGFSGEKKPKGYLHCYRDLEGERGVEIVRGFEEISENFMKETIGMKEGVFVSRGFHFPVRTQYSTLHMQIRVNSGSVVGADGRGIALEDVAARLTANSGSFGEDGENLRFRVTENIKSNLLAAAAGAAQQDYYEDTTESRANETTEGE